MDLLITVLGWILFVSGTVLGVVLILFHLIGVLWKYTLRTVKSGVTYYDLLHIKRVKKKLNDASTLGPPRPPKNIDPNVDLKESGLNS